MMRITPIKAVTMASRSQTIRGSFSRILAKIADQIGVVKKRQAATETGKYLVELNSP